MKNKIHGLLVLAMFISCVTTTYAAQQGQEPFNFAKFSELPPEIQVNALAPEFERYIEPAQTIPKLYNLVKQWNTNPIFIATSHANRHAILKQEKKILSSIIRLLPNLDNIKISEFKNPVEELIIYVQRIQPTFSKDPKQREEELKKLDVVLGTTTKQRFSILKRILSTLLINFKVYAEGENQYDLVSKLLENGADPNFTIDGLYKGPVLQELIFGDGKNIETITVLARDGRPIPTYIQWPDLTTHLGIIHLLLKYKANPNQESSSGVSCAEGISNMWVWNNKPENQNNVNKQVINQFCDKAMNLLLSYKAEETNTIINNAQTLLEQGIKGLAHLLYMNNQRKQIIGEQSGTKRKSPERGGNAN